ncbi:uncharacterized protein B0P05DRAFT_521161 [Gilbertella persicaria]|uniref:uncharacterized protein n=1 Tax=Gilbertella persicaria TaxID=101096 RepID=UPI00221EE72C|nr:uncharacterized protein B0P05DRAFT_521161 [Gilbertella persicaria]KAI8098272.1 hypothetical protein B0P05DRAFT_521161 [Gilbertella persicaria]
MDLKYLLCEPVSRLSVKANDAFKKSQQKQYQPIGLEWPSESVYPSVSSSQQEWHHNQPTMIISSPKSVCSSISTCSSASSNSVSSHEEINAISRGPGRSQSLGSLSSYAQEHSPQKYQARRRTASDVSLTRHHMFIYSHPNRRPRSESAGNNSSSHNNSNVQTRTPWTPIEDHLLQQGYDQGLSWAMISSTYLPHRSRGCCWGRFKTLQNKNMIDPNHSHMRHFRRPWKAIDFTNTNKKLGL